MIILLLVGFLNTILDDTSPTFSFGLIIGIYLLHYLYAILHRRLPTSHTASVLSLLVFSAGQIYNRQYIKAVFFIILYSVAYYYFINTNGRNLMFFILITITVVSAVDASKNAKKAIIPFLQKQRERIVTLKLSKLADLKNEEFELGLHTDILMLEPDLLVKMLETYKYRLYLSKQVFSEINRLTKHASTKEQAEIALDVIEEFQRQDALELLETPDRNKLKVFGLKESGGEKIIGTYLNSEKNFVFLSNDKGARVISRNAGLPVVEV